METTPAASTSKFEAIKPKQEPSAADELPPPPSSEDPATTPLVAGNPFFTTIMSRSHAAKKFQMSIPTRFQRHLPEARTPAVLVCGGRSWPASYCGDLKTKKLDSGWAGFAVDNRLRVGDACVFELVKENVDEMAICLRVQILRGDLPVEVTSKGATSDEPIVIVDDD